MSKKKDKIKVDRTSGNKKIAVIWTRVSTKEQAENNLSLETQEKACLEYAEKNDIEVDSIKGRTNESAKVQGKKFREMIGYVANHRRINTILVYSYDRFSRAGADAIITKAYLKSKGITLISVTQPIDSDNEAGILLENMLFLFNEFENNLRKGKCTAGMIECLEQGNWFSKPPMGYEKDPSGGEHALMINETGRLLGLAFKWKAEELLSDAEIITKLEARGLTIYKQRLSEVFHNPFYCGKIQHQLLGDRVVLGNHPAIIDVDTWNIVNGIQTHAGYEHMEATPDVPLKRFLVCTCCGKHLTGYEVKKKHLWYYKCNTPGCKFNLSAKAVHSRFEELLGDYDMPDVFTHILSDMISKIIVEHKGTSALELSELRKRRTLLEKQIEKATINFGIGEIPREVYDAVKRGKGKELDDVEAEIKKLEATSNPEIDVEAILLTTCNLRTLWNIGDFYTKQKLQNLAFPEGISWTKGEDRPRTIKENELLMLIRSFRGTYTAKEGGKKIQKKEKSCDFSDLVAYAIEKSELFLKSLAEIYDFADYWDKYGRVVFREERKPKRVFRKKK